ncbi:Glycoside hydrolase, superfamily [Pseudocohnilembus persalinus]|uniref:Glycoside hydrolase, superfamily n=1 Tax=Pseudocohnilembus persalinus TaxID=266149 RepID=A0A0V0R6W6_PSEPJ|nr:Glycoside hydrolase, superfamily [Pseudocohnilembus persalinus]|eukprot:KRX10244.1 Glycoside hydrolase, superfamily [Pseudocohnilembus persalinus]
MSQFLISLDGKQVLISIGGAVNTINDIKNNQESFISNVNNLIEQYDLDGIDLDIQIFNFTPQDLIDTIVFIRSQLGDLKKLVITTQSVCIYPSDKVYVPELDESEYFWNFMVPVINQVIDLIDFIQVDTVRNPYLEIDVFSAEYMTAIYLGWLNVYPDFQIEGYDGIPEDKLVLSFVASENTIEDAYYHEPSVINQAIDMLAKLGYKLYGFNVYNSFYDGENNFTVSSQVYAHLENIYDSRNDSSNLVNAEKLSEQHLNTDDIQYNVKNTQGIYDQNEDDEKESIYGTIMALNMTILFAIILSVFN